MDHAVLSQIVHHKWLPVILAVSAAAGCFPRIMYGADGRSSRVTLALFWIAALGVLILRACTFPMNDDEVYWLTSSWAAGHGCVTGQLPLRMFLFQPFLALGLRPASTIVIGRCAVFLMAVACGLIGTATARRDHDAGRTWLLAGPLIVLCMANLPMTFLRPEYFAGFFLLVGAWALSAAPGRWKREVSVIAGFSMLGLAAATSFRLVPFLLGGMLAVMLEPGGIARIRAVACAALGALIGIGPTLAMIAHGHLLPSIIRSNFIVPRSMGVLGTDIVPHVPLLFFILAVGACAMVWNHPGRRGGDRTIVVLWVTATVAAMLNPLKFIYSLGPWFLCSSLACAAALSCLATSRAGLKAMRPVVFLAGVLALSAALGPVRALANPPVGMADLKRLGSQLGLIDWLDETGLGKPVMCVVPYHPVRAVNEWNRWDAWIYCAVRDRRLNAELDPRLEQTLFSTPCAIIGWDPWPVAMEANIAAYAVDRGFVAPGHADSLVASLARRYRLVKWKGPLPEDYGGGRFLVRRDLPPDTRVRVLHDSIILNGLGRPFAAGKR